MSGDRHELLPEGRYGADHEDLRNHCRRGWGKVGNSRGRYDTQLCTSGAQGRALNQAAARFHTGRTDRHVDLQKVRQAFIHAFACVVDRVGTLSPTAKYPLEMILGNKVIIRRNPSGTQLPPTMLTQSS